MSSMDKLKNAIIEGDEDLAAVAAQEIVDGGTDVQNAIAMMTDVMRILGKQFEEFEIFLPEMMVAADAMLAALAVIEPVLLASGGLKRKGTVVIGTAPGDMHEIGKNIVATVLKADGFTVIDLGKNVPAMTFVEEAHKSNADIVGISALMTTTMPGIKDVMDLMNSKGYRADHKVIAGGAPTNPVWAEQMGCDGWSESASECVVLCNKLIGAE